MYDEVFYLKEILEQLEYLSFLAVVGIVIKIYQIFFKEKKK